MKRKCECGHEFEVPEGAGAVKCPSCGRQVAGGVSEDWLSSLDLGDMTLEGEPAPTAPQPAQPPAGTPRPEAATSGAPARPAVPEGGELELELEGEEQPAAPVSPRPTVPSRRRTATQMKTASTVQKAPPRTLLDLFRLVSAEPRNAVTHFEDGIRTKRFMVQMVVALLVLSLIAGFLHAWMLSPKEFLLGQGLRNWMGIFVDLAVGTMCVGMLCYGFKKPSKPLGIGQALACARIGALVVAVPVMAVLAAVVAVLVWRGSMTQYVRWSVHNIWTLYFLIVFCLQALVVMGFLKLGCLLGIVLGAVFTYGGYTLAQDFLGAF